MLRAKGVLLPAGTQTSTLKKFDGGRLRHSMNQAAAKTGTAELGVASNPDLSHAWIVAFAPAEAPQYAVSVVLTNVQSTEDVAATGGRLAGPIAEGMLDFLLTGAGAR